MPTHLHQKIPVSVIMLGVVSLFTDAASEMIYPLVPMYISALGSGAVVLGIIEGIAETTAAMLKLISGIISDKFGKRKVLVLTGYTISTIARPFTGIVSAAWEIVFIRMLDRVGKGIRSAPRDALIATSVDERIRGKAFGFHRAMDHAGAVVGPLLAIMALLVLMSLFRVNDALTALRWTFILSIIPGTFAVLTIIFFVKESTSSKRRLTSYTFSFLNFDKNFITYLFVLVLFTLGNSSDAFLLFRVEEAIRTNGFFVNFVNSSPIFHNLLVNFGNSAQQSQLINLLFLPLVWSFFHVIKVVFSTPLGALSDRIGRKITIAIGWGIYTLVYIGFALLTAFPSAMQIPGTFILFAVYALFYAFTEGTEKALVADIVKEEQRGSAFGLYNFAVGLGALPASIIFGFLYSHFNIIIPGLGGTVAFGFGGAIAFVAMVLLLLFVNDSKNVSDHS